MTPPPPQSIRTERIELVPSTAALVRAEIGDLTALGAALNAAIPADWPPEEVRDVLPLFRKRLEEIEQEDPARGAGRWVTYYWVSTVEAGVPRTLIGSGGFMGSPLASESGNLDDAGTVEIGYGTHAAYRRRGYAAEAVRALAEFAHSQPEVKRVVADALPENTGSVGVLARSNFLEVGEGAEEGTRRFEYRP